MKISRRERLIDEMQMLYGIPPYDDGGNIVKGDGYFAKGLRKRINNFKYNWDEILEQAKDKGRKETPCWDK